MTFTPFPAQVPPQEITSLPEKTTPIGTDEIIISDSEDSNTAKKVQLANLPYPPTQAGFGYTEQLLSTYIARPAPNGVYNDSVYGGDKFVAISNSNNFAYSYDGVTWISTTNPSLNEYWSSVTYGNGLFVAVANNGAGATNTRICTSPDGITWTLRSHPAAAGLEDVIYGNGVFVIVAPSIAFTSPDGITWTSQTVPAQSWRGVTFGNNLFVAVAVSGTGNRVMTSPDGITWTSQTTPADNNWFRITYGKGLYVAVSQTGTGNRVMTSPDGITWTIRVSAADNTYMRVKYGNGMFVAVAQTGASNRIALSANGINWYTRSGIGDLTYLGIAFQNNMFVFAASTGSTSTSISSTPYYYVEP